MSTPLTLWNAVEFRGSRSPSRPRTTPSSPSLSSLDSPASPCQGPAEIANNVPQRIRQPSFLELNAARLMN